MSESPSDRLDIPSPAHPPLNLPPTAAEVDARLARQRQTKMEREGGQCPTCGQAVAPLTNRFTTGGQGIAPPAMHEPDGALDPDGELGYAIFMRLRQHEQVLDICAALDVTPQQVGGIARAYERRLNKTASPRSAA